MPKTFSTRIISWDFSTILPCFALYLSLLVFSIVILVLSNFAFLLGYDGTGCDSSVTTILSGTTAIALILKDTWVIHD